MATQELRELIRIGLVPARHAAGGLHVFAYFKTWAGTRRATRSAFVTASPTAWIRLLQSPRMPTPAHLALTPEIGAFRRQFDQLADDADALVAPLSDEQFSWQPPAPTEGIPSWSIAQCIDHLNVTARLYLPQLDEGIANAIRQGQYAEGPFTYWWLARMFVRMLEPPPRFRMKAPPSFQPPPSRTRREIMAAFRAYQVQYVDRLRQANGLDLARARVRSPAASWISMPLGTGFAGMTAHERRHLWQARKVIDAPGFPK